MAASASESASSSATNVNGIFTEQCQESLRQLKSKLEALQTKEYKDNEASEYSFKSLENLISAINLLLELDDINDWKKSQNQEKLKAHFDYISYQSGIYVPEIFNLQSYEMAKLCHEFMSQFDVDTMLNLQWGVKKILEAALGDLTQFVYRAQINIEHKVKLYEWFMASESAQATENEINTDIDAYVTAIEKDPTRFNASEYSQKVDDWLARAATIPYIRLAGCGEYFLNKAQPVYLQKGEELVIRGCRANLLNNLANNEKYLADRVLQDGPNYARESIQKLVLENPSTLAESKDTLLNRFASLLEEYGTGSHLPWYKWIAGVDKNKLEILTSLQKKLADKFSEKGPLNFLCSEAMAHVLTAISAHNSYVKTKETATGKTGAILNQLYVDFFNLVMLSKEADDENLLRTLEVTLDAAAVASSSSSHMP